ncbi:MAG: hypothetical protein CME15_07015 [Gemmatimonadetes bacterium]|nr:hypothetical protein [Gemmatimonadota bacterium]
MQRLPHLLLFAIGLAGTLGVGYQIAWTRLLVPVVGSSVYAFTIILTTVLLGIGVGALLAALPQLRQVSYQRAVALTMGIGACSAIAGLFAVNLLPELFAVMAQRFGERTWLLFMAQGALTACVLFVPACSLGAALPLGIAAWRHAAGSAGWAVGGMYAMNTLGAILGSLLAGFFLLPLLGATHLVLGGAALGIAAAVALLLSQPSARRSRAWLQAGALVALFACSVATVPETDITQLQRGIFRGIHHNTGLSEIKTVLLHAEEGTSATVTVFRTPNSTVLKVNGKADASTGGDVDTQYLIGHIPLFLHPTPGSACIIGYGSGATVHAVSTHPQIQSIDVVEIEQAVLNASRYFHSINFNVLHDPRVHLFLEDGRNFLQRREATYDIIISQPSNPWIAGISSLFTTEYYQAVKERINRGGLFCQWIQTYEISASTRQVMLQTLTSVFPYVTVFSIDGDLICLAAKQPLRGSAALYAERLAVEAVRRSLDRIQINDAFDLFASAYTQYPTERVPFSSSTRNTDDNLWLEYRAPIEMYRGTNEPLAPVRLEVFVPVIRQLFPDLSTEELISNTARSIARRYPERWYVLDEWARSSEQPPALARDLRRRSKDAQARHEALSQNGERFTRANALARARRYSDAVPLYEAILATDPRDGAAHRMLAWSLTRLGHGNRAWTHYQQAIDLNVDDFEALTNMAALALSSGKQEGVDLLERALQTNPHYGTAYRIYLQFLRDQRQFEQAQSILQRAHRYLGEEERSQLEQIVASAQ